MMVALCPAGFQFGCSICCERTCRKGMRCLCVACQMGYSHVTRISHGNGNDCMFLFSGDCIHTYMHTYIHTYIHRPVASKFQVVRP